MREQMVAPAERYSMWLTNASPLLDLSETGTYEIVNDAFRVVVLPNVTVDDQAAVYRVAGRSMILVDG